MNMEYKKTKAYDSLTCVLKRELSNNKVMIIITGIPGSGKSTAMRELQEGVSSDDINAFYPWMTLRFWNTKSMDFVM